MKKVLLINPPIYDFKCYDEWMYPLGLYFISTILKKMNVKIYYINVLNRFNPKLRYFKNKQFGTGEYNNTIVTKPYLYEIIPRHYKRYGYPTILFEEELNQIPNLDLIMITSYMTYWYQGVLDTIYRIRNNTIHRKTPILLGGIYASLCTEHAKLICKPDDIINGKMNDKNISKIADYLGISSQEFEWNRIVPDYSIEESNIARPILLASGCPNNCSYCASSVLDKNYIEYPTEQIAELIIKSKMDKNINDFSFYDDALLYRFNNKLKPFLDIINDEKININFHANNALHARFITEEVAYYLFNSGFKTIRLGFETAKKSLQESTGNKVTNINIKNAINNLISAGYEKKDIGLYIMVGLPDQNMEDIKESIDLLKEIDVKPKLVRLSPIPHTKVYEQLKKEFPIIETEPLSHNDTFFSIYSGAINNQEYKDLQIYINS